MVSLLIADLFAKLRTQRSTVTWLLIANRDHINLQEVPGHAGVVPVPLCNLIEMIIDPCEFLRYIHLD